MIKTISVYKPELSQKLKNPIAWGLVRIGKYSSRKGKLSSGWKILLKDKISTRGNKNP